MFHVSQVPRAHTSPLRSGMTTYIMRRFELDAWLAYIERYEITECNMVPMMVVKVLASPHVSKKTLRSVKYAWTGAAPLDKSLQLRFKALLPKDAPFVQVWGMSETSCIATMTYYPEHDESGSCGWAVPNLDLKIVDDAGKDVSEWGARGELCVRGPIIVSGYFENPQRSQEDWDDDGFFHTGDIAYIEGPDPPRLFIVDRKKVSARLSCRLVVSYN